MIVVLFLHTKTTTLVTQTHRGVRKLIADYRPTCLILPVAIEEVVYFYVSSEETGSKKLNKHEEELKCKSTGFEVQCPIIPGNPKTL